MQVFFPFSHSSTARHTQKREMKFMRENNCVCAFHWYGNSILTFEDLFVSILFFFFFFARENEWKMSVFGNLLVWYIGWILVLFLKLFELCRWYLDSCILSLDIWQRIWMYCNKAYDIWAIREFIGCEIQFLSCYSPSSLFSSSIEVKFFKNFLLSVLTYPLPGIQPEKKIVIFS